MKLTTITKRMEALVNESSHRSLKGTVAYRMVNNAIATGELIRLITHYLRLWRF
jgi:hypothetical protein